MGEVELGSQDKSRDIKTKGSKGCRAKSCANQSGDDWRSRPYLKALLKGGSDPKRFWVASCGPEPTTSVVCGVSFPARWPDYPASKLKKVLYMIRQTTGECIV